MTPTDSEIEEFASQVDDPAHKMVVTEEEGKAVFAMAAVFGYPVKMATGLPVMLIDDVDDLWMVDAVKAVRRKEPGDG
jgi:hypothetical protein